MRILKKFSLVFLCTKCTQTLTFENLLQEECCGLLHLLAPRIGGGAVGVWGWEEGGGGGKGERGGREVEGARGRRSLRGGGGGGGGRGDEGVGDWARWGCFN